MHTSDVVLGDRGYESGHVETVLSRIRENFKRYWAQFAPNARESFRDTLKHWEDAHPDYVEILDDGFLNEHEDDAKAFKNALRSKCPNDLFAFYSLNVHRLLKDACTAAKIALRPDRRYVYVDSF